MKATYSIFLLFFLPACGATSPVYDIHFAGTDQIPEIDFAWAKACSIAGLNPHTTAEGQWIQFFVQSEPLIIAGYAEPLHGVAGDTTAQVQQIGPNILDADTPTVHEFLHVALGIATGNPDSGHTHSYWHEANVDFTAEFTEEEQ